MANLNSEVNKFDSEGGTTSSSTTSSTSNSPAPSCSSYAEHESFTSSSTGSPVFTPPHRVMSSLPNAIQAMITDVLEAQEASSPTTEPKTRALCSFYSTLMPQDRLVFLRTLAEVFSVDHNSIVNLSLSFKSAKDKGNGSLLKAEDRLRHALIPKYQMIFTQIGHLENGVKFLVDMRADILNILTSHGADQDNPYLRVLNSNLKDLISLWFSVGFLQLERITWESPCDFLQKISEYEAVHPIRNWTDLKRRVGAYRRCFVFTHHSMPREPVVVLHTALTDEISNSIQSIVLHPTPSQESIDIDGTQLEDPAVINTVIFYSITSTQKGLQGIEMGNYLIKRVVRELQAEFPKLTNFASLSPIPGFREWLLGEVNTIIHAQKIGEHPEQLLFTSQEMIDICSCVTKSNNVLPMEVVKQLLTTNDWVQSEELPSVLEVPLTRLCARYLYVEKRRGFALNPVANFHLRNGAVMWRINWMADLTSRGLNASFGLMVNYRYYLDETQMNSINYIEKQRIKTSTQILDLVKTLPDCPLDTKSHL